MLTGLEGRGKDEERGRKGIGCLDQNLKIKGCREETGTTGKRGEVRRKSAKLLSC